MREPINATQVKEAFTAIYRCLDEVSKLAELARRLHEKHKVPTRPDEVNLPRSAASEMAECIAGLQGTWKDAAARLATLDSELPALTDRPIEHKGSVGSSWAETLTLTAGRLTEHLSEWRRFHAVAKDRRRYLFHCVLVLTDGLGQFKANLKMEEARLGKLALPAKARYRAMLLQLSDRDSLLMELFIENEGKWLGHEDVAECLWPGEVVEGPTIHKAVSRLRRELVTLSYNEVVAAIESGRGRYRFRGCRMGEV